MKDEHVEKVIVSIGKLLLLVLKILFCGLKVLWKKRDRNIFLLTGIIIILSMAIYFIFESLSMTSVPGLIYLFIPGFVFELKSLKNRTIERAFKKINFKDKSGYYPKVLEVKKKTKNREVIYCFSYIPFRNWMDQIELLETALNGKLKIIQDGKQKVKLIKWGV